MSDASTVPTPDRTREIEMRLFEEIGAQIKGMADSMREFGADMRDVRERLIRIEAQDQPQKIAKLEDALSEAHDEIARVERGSEAALAKAQADNAAALAKAAYDQASDKLALEKRLTRMEVIIAPLTALGSALLAAIVGAMVTTFTGHIH